jgi:hypothetical protein
VKQAREELSNKLVDEYKDRSVEELDADTVFGMSIDEASVLLEKEVHRCPQPPLLYAVLPQENHKKALEIVIAKCDDLEEMQQFEDKMNIIDGNRRLLIQAIDELLTKEVELKQVNRVCAHDFKSISRRRHRSTTRQKTKTLKRNANTARFSEQQSCSIQFIPHSRFHV